MEMTVCVYVFMSPVSAASPLLKLVPSPSCPFAPDAEHTEDGHLNHTHKQKFRLHCRRLAFTGITLTWWISWAFKSNDSFLNMGAATDGAQTLQSIINRPFDLNPYALKYRRLNQGLYINTGCWPTCRFLYYLCREVMISPVPFCVMVLSGRHKNRIKGAHPFFDIFVAILGNNAWILMKKRHVWKADIYELEQFHVDPTCGKVKLSLSSYGWFKI